VNSLLAGGQLAATSLEEDDFEFLGEKFFEFSYLMKAEYLFAWHYRNFALFLKYQKTVFPFHPSLSLYSSALTNERMKAPFCFVPSFISSEIGDFLCFPLWKVGLSFILSDILGTLYIIVYKEDFLKRMKAPFTYIQSYTYYIDVICETSCFLSCTSFVNLHSPSNYHTFIRLRVNE
jgi:hypothetical protein